MRYGLAIVYGVLAASIFIYACVQNGQEPVGFAYAADKDAVIGAPEALRLKIVQNGFLLNWKPSAQDPGPVTGYEVVRSDRFTGPYERVGQADRGISRYIDSTAAREIIYFYKVRALTEKGASSFSNTVTGER